MPWNECKPMHTMTASWKNLSSIPAPPGLLSPVIFTCEISCSTNVTFTRLTLKIVSCLIGSFEAPLLSKTCCAPARRLMVRTGKCDEMRSCNALSKHPWSRVRPFRSVQTLNSGHSPCRDAGVGGHLVDHRRVMICRQPGADLTTSGSRLDRARLVADNAECVGILHQSPGKTRISCDGFPGKIDSLLALPLAGIRNRSVVHPVGRTGVHRGRRQYPIHDSVDFLQVVPGA